ncbi:hypothetical protein AOLI_G00292010 [Acnodon oligacanthus]
MRRTRASCHARGSLLLTLCRDLPGLQAAAVCEFSPLLPELIHQSVDTSRLRVQLTPTDPRSPTTRGSWPGPILFQTVSTPPPLRPLAPAVALLWTLG